MVAGKVLHDADLVRRVDEAEARIAELEVHRKVQAFFVLASVVVVTKCVRPAGICAMMCLSLTAVSLQTLYRVIGSAP